MMAGVVPVSNTQHSTALKALSAHKLSTCILQAVAKLPKLLSLKIPDIRFTGELVEQMPSVILALDLYLDNAIRSSLMLQEIRSFFLDSSYRPPAPVPLNHLQDPSIEH